MHDVASKDQLGRLLQRLIDLLPGLPGFRTLSIFGSMAEGRADGYSDLDLMVTTDDLPAARVCLLGLLEIVGPVEFCWVISLRPQEWNPTIAFTEEGYYHRLDIGLVAADAADRTIPEAQTTLLVEGRPAASQTTLCESGAYVPQQGSVGHFLLGQCIGGLRYLKARKRGRGATCYRFSAAMVDWRLRAHYAWLTGDYVLHDRLTTDEYRTLDNLLTAEQCAELLRPLDFSTPAAMDQAVCLTLGHLIDDCRVLAAAQDEPWPDGLFDRMQVFYRHELAIEDGAQRL